jgi:hypothetical protein
VLKMIRLPWINHAEVFPYRQEFLPVRTGT